MLNVYRASAGSGKTYRLTYEYIKMLLGRRIYADDNAQDKKEHYAFYERYNSPHRRILAVTFTNKATDEMKQRIVRQLDILAHDVTQSDYCKQLCEAFDCDAIQLQRNAETVLLQLLYDFSYFNISTIDSFFQQILRAFTREMGLQGGYEVELDDDYVTSAAIDRMFAELDDNKQMFEWLLQYADENIRNGGRWDIHEHSDIPKLAKHLTSEVYKNYRKELLQKNLEDYKSYIESLNIYRDSIRRSIADASQDILTEMASLGVTDNEFNRGWSKIFTDLNDVSLVDASSKAPLGKAIEVFLKKYEDPSTWFTATKLKKAHLDAAVLESSLTPYFDNLAGIIRSSIMQYRSVSVSLKHIYALGVLSTIDNNVATYEKEHNTLLLNKTSEILKGLINQNDTPFIYEKVGTRIAHYMIDEFQDTSNLQWDNFHPLVSESLAWRNENYIVGDVKQSIYRWRNSDWKLLHSGLDELNYNDVSPDRDTNWRSCAGIIAYNNSFFKVAAQKLQDELCRKIETALPDNKHIKPVLSGIYDTVAQKVAPKNRERSGHVAVHILNSTNKDLYSQDIFERVADDLRSLFEKGYTAKDIAFLTCKGEEGRSIVEFLLSLSAEDDGVLRNVRVVSDESLLIASAPPIKLIIGILRYILKPQYPINEMILAYEYNVMTDSNHDVNRALNKYFDNRKSQLPIDDELQAFIDLISTKPLFEMCELIIDKYEMNKTTEYVAYIEAFQDAVVNYCRLHTPDLYSFLRWWDEHEKSLAVKSPQNIDAIKVMTIHKSKGLEFPVVFIPFATWSLTKSSQSPMKWYVPTVAPFDAFPILPIDHSGELAHTIYAEQYFEEVINEYIDSLNLAYVAFTRASQELIAYTYVPPKNGAEYLGYFIREVLCATVEPDEMGCETVDFYSNVVSDDNETIFEIGKEWTPDVAHDERDDKTLISEVPYEVVIPSTSRLQQRISSGSVSGDEKRNYGILMHDILSEVYTIEDVPNVIQRYVRDGRLRSRKALKMQKKLQQIISDESVARWFAPGLKVVNETEIIKFGEDIKRPDRVVIDGDRVAVIDYKFGQVEAEEYIVKVAEYMQLMRDMGYKQVEGYIWYIEKEKIVTVE